MKPALALALSLVMACVLLVLACGPSGPVDPNPTTTPTPMAPADSQPTTVPTLTDPVDPDPTAAPTPAESVEPTARLLAPTPIPLMTSDTFPYHGITTLEERIFRADVVAYVRPVSVLGKWKTIPSDEGVAPTYLPFLEVHFEAIEYLKGSGDTEIIVEEPDRYTYVSEEIAQSAAGGMLRIHNNAWDDDEAVVFLEEGLGASGPADSRYRFVLAKLDTGFQRKYALDSDNKAWLPRDDSSSGDPVFLTDSDPGGGGELPVITLEDLRSSVEAVDALVEEGKGIDGYEYCLVQKFGVERHLREW